MHETVIGIIKERGGTVSEKTQDGRRIVKVDFRGANVSGDDLRLLEGLIGLESLDLRATSVTSKSLVHLKPHKALKRLFLSNVNYERGLGPRPISHLVDMSAMEELHLGVTQLTDGDLADLANIESLKKLVLFANRIGDRGMAHLKGLRSLEWLDLSGTDVGDVGLASLSHLKNLHYLDLYGTKVTDSGLKHLEGSTKLKDVNLTGASVTKSGVERLQKALPNTKLAFSE